MKKTLILACLFFICSGYARCEEWLPFKKIFKPLTADITNPAFGVRLTSIVGSKRLAEINMGDEFAIVNLPLNETSSLQLGAMGGVIARFDISRVTNDIQIADYSFAVPVDWKINNSLILRAMYWHTSSHLGDDYIKSNELEPWLLKKNVTDDVRIMASWQALKWLRLYGGGGYAFNQIPHLDKPWRFQAGAEAWHPLSEATSLFLAADMATKENLKWQTSFTSRAGVEFASSKAAVAFYLEFFTGRPVYLGLMNQKETHWSFGFTAKM